MLGRGGVSLRRHALSRGDGASDPVVLGRVEQLAGVCAAAVGFAEPRQHPGQFGDPLLDWEVPASDKLQLVDPLLAW